MYFLYLKCTFLGLKSVAIAVLQNFFGLRIILSILYFLVMHLKCTSGNSGCLLIDTVL